MEEAVDLFDMLTAITQRANIELLKHVSRMDGEPRIVPWSLPIIKGRKRWLAAWMTPLREAPNQTDYCSRVLGSRSDGQAFQVMAVVPFEPREDAAERCWKAVQESIDKLLTYRDCTCGIVGYRTTDQVDEDGDPIVRAILNECSQHAPIVRPAD
jgi:hypothetical protein